MKYLQTRLAASSHTYGLHQTTAKSQVMRLLRTVASLFRASLPIAEHALAINVQSYTRQSASQTLCYAPCMPKLAMQPVAPGLHLSLNQLAWRSSTPRITIKDIVQSVVMMVCMYAVMCLVVVLLGLLLVTPFVLARGEDWIEMAQGWFAPEVWSLFLLVIVVLAITPYVFGFFVRINEAYVFDPSVQVLVVEDCRFLFFRQLKRYPFSAISSIQPILGTSGGYLFVTLQNPKGQIKNIDLGEDFSRTELETQAQWLENQLGGRIEALYESAGD